VKPVRGLGECPEAGRLLGEARRAKKLSLRKVAAACGIAHSTVDFIEKGMRPSPELAFLLLTAVAMGPAQRLVCIGQWSERSLEDAVRWHAMQTSANRRLREGADD
jgi:transcriptional regulator with XRE-family HTH domain